MMAPAAPVVLTVDDNEAVRYVVARTLRSAGFEVRECGTGQDALRHAHTEPPDLILLDVKLPDLDGFEVCRRLKADPETASIPVLQMTATYGSSQNWADALDAGADGYLTHPAEPVVLIATVRALLRARAAERALREANRVKDEFLAVLSHELRTPLNAIVGWAHVLRTQRDPALVARGLDAIQRNAEAQARLVGDILDVSRIVAGKMTIERHGVDLGKVVEAALETVRHVVQARQLALQLSLEERVTVMGDASRLQQIVWNLLSNAVKFTPTGGAVRVRLRQEEGEAVLTVEDTGIGIDPTFLPFVFDRFRQADASMARSVTGLGLGLALARDLVKIHGGTIVATSGGKGQGARFTLTLPVASATEAPADETVEAPSPVAESLEGVRVLIVDDDADYLASLQVYLAGRGAAVVCADSAEKALAAVAGARPDVIVSDLGMPREDGYALIRSLRARRAEDGGVIPAVALTAYASEHDRERSLAAGYQLHVAKPADPAQVARAVARLAAHND